MLLSLHPTGRARFWGAITRYDSSFDQLVTGDVVLFTGQRRIQAVGRIGCKFRNQMLADLLWAPTRSGEAGPTSIACSISASTRA